MPNIRVMHFGLGPIGAAIVKQVAARPGFKIVGAIDIDPAKVGRDLGDVVGLPKRLGVKVSGDAAKALKSAKPDVVVLCTSSSIKKVMPQIETILKAKIADRLDDRGARLSRLHAHPAGAADSRVAKKAKVAVLGTGVNPGLRDGRAADRADRRLRARRPHRRSTACRTRASGGCRSSRRSAPASRPSSSRRRSDDGSVRHVGLTESIAMIADAMGWTLDRITDDIQPKLATVTISSEFLAVDPGLRLRHHPGRRRLPEGRAGDPAAHGGVPRRAGTVRLGRDRRVAAACR